MEHTKGKWTLEQHSSGSLRIVSGNKNIAVTSEAKAVIDAVEVLANAHLIAAAPDLYEAQHILHNWGGYGQIPMHIRNLFAKARAKAEGK